MNKNLSKKRLVEFTLEKYLTRGYCDSCSNTGCSDCSPMPSHDDAQNISEAISYNRDNNSKWN